MEGGHYKPYTSIPIPTTTGLNKPINANAPYSQVPVLAFLIDKVTHTRGLPRCTGALSFEIVGGNVPMMDML